MLDVEIHLDVKGLGNAILPRKEASNQDKAKAMIFLRYHLHKRLIAEYIIIKIHLNYGIISKKYMTIKNQ